MNGRPQVNARVFWPMAAIGATIMGFGIYGLVDDASRTHPDQWIRWFLGAALVHDLALAPLVAVVGVVARQVPTPYRAIAQGALIVSGLVALTSYPFVRGYGRLPDNPSALPNNYVLGLLAVVAVIWSIAGCLGWRAHRQARHPERRRDTSASKKNSH